MPSAVPIVVRGESTGDLAGVSLCVDELEADLAARDHDSCLCCMMSAASYGSIVLIVISINVGSCRAVGLSKYEPGDGCCSTII